MKIDIHTHVLPGIDDGAKNWEMCLTMLSQSYECGVEVVFATPHYEPWNKTATVEEIRTLCKEAKEKLQTERGITMEIYPGCEIYYNLEVVDKLKRGELATLAGSRYVLVEFKPSAQYRELCRAVKEFRDAGYIPIIAHVERYECLKNLEKMRELKELGALFQMNLEAIQGSMFHAETQRAKKCLKQELIDFIASDMHSLGVRSPMKKEKLRWIQAKLSPEYREELLCDNAQKILNSIKE